MQHHSLTHSADHRVRDRSKSTCFWGRGEGVQARSTKRHEGMGTVFTMRTFQKGFFNKIEMRCLLRCLLNPRCLLRCLLELFEMPFQITSKTKLCWDAIWDAFWQNKIILRCHFRCFLAKQNYFEMPFEMPFAKTKLLRCHLRCHLEETKFTQTRWHPQ